jgi:hypothetical protein
MQTGQRKGSLPSHATQKNPRWSSREATGDLCLEVHAASKKPVDHWPSPRPDLFMHACAYGHAVPGRRRSRFWLQLILLFGTCGLLTTSL